jgi:hypothetical protein
MLRVPPHALSYTKIRLSWPRGDYCCFLVSGFPDSFRIPIAFFNGTKCCNLAFAEELLQMLVDEPGELVLEDGTPVNPEDPPVAFANYLFRPGECGVEGHAIV